MVYTFKQLRDQVARRIDDTSTTTDTIIKDLMNDALPQRFMERPWPWRLHPQVPDRRIDKPRTGSTRPTAIVRSRQGRAV